MTSSGILPENPFFPRSIPFKVEMLKMADGIGLVKLLLLRHKYSKLGRKLISSGMVPTIKLFPIKYKSSL